MTTRTTPHPDNVTLTGSAAIAYAREHGMYLCKYADPTEGARTGLTVAEAEAVASEDGSLVWLDTRGVGAEAWTTQVRDLHSDDAARELGDEAYFSVCWRDDEGVERFAEGVTLALVAASLKAQGYMGASLRVLDVAGFTRGWASANYWRSA